MFRVYRATQRSALVTAAIFITTHRTLIIHNSRENQFVAVFSAPALTRSAVLTLRIEHNRRTNQWDPWAQLGLIDDAPARFLPLFDNPIWLQDAIFDRLARPSLSWKQIACEELSPRGAHEHRRLPHCERSHLMNDRVSTDAHNEDSPTSPTYAERAIEISDRCENKLPGARDLRPPPILKYSNH